MKHGAGAALIACLMGLAAAGAGLTGEEDKVKEAFKGFQDAVKARDADKLWDLLDATSRKAAERTARTYKDAYGKAKEDKRKELEKNLGLTSDELANLTGKTYLKSNKYHGKYHEVPSGRIDRVAFEEKKATVFYTEDDGDKVKLDFANEDGKWRAVAAP